ncbi:MAG: hypothetical protein ACI4I5_03540 [Acutalibacteraceae bacterium]
MNEWAVLGALREIAVLQQDAAAEALPLCRSALESLTSRLKPGADPADSRLIRAAAGLAYYKWILRNFAGTDGITSFKAGDVTVSRSSACTLEQAEKVRDESLLAALPLLTDDAFLFCSV